MYWKEFFPDGFYFVYDFCMAAEKEYTDMRKDIPLQFSGIEEFLTDIENENLCEVAYTEIDLNKVSECQEVLNGLLNKGLSNIISYMYAYFNKVYLMFDSIGDYKERDEQFLRS